MATSFLKNTNKGLFLEVTVVQTFKAFTVTSFIFCHFMNSVIFNMIELPLIYYLPFHIIGMLLHMVLISKRNSFFL